MVAAPALIPVDAGHPDALSINGLIGLVRGQTREDVHLLGNLTVDGTVSVGGITADTIHATGAGTALAVDHDATIGGALVVAGVVHLTGAGTTLQVDHDATIGGALAVTGDVTTSGNLAWKSGMAYSVTLDHTATANRTVVYQDLAGTVTLLGAQNAGHLLWLDNTYDMGASGATRPRDLFLARNASIGGTLGVTGVTTLSDNLLWSADNAKDIGASGATRPRDLFLGRNATIGGTLGVTGTITASNALNAGGLISANGGQIAFPAAQNAAADANTLDDYEEGTFTPTIAGAPAATYITNTGSYTKVGNRVSFELHILINARNSGSQSVISGLPFAAGDNAVVTVGYFTNSANNFVYLTGLIGVGTSTVQLGALTAAGAATTAAVFFQNNSEIVLSGTYHT